MINFILFSSLKYFPRFMVLYDSIRKFYPSAPIHLYGLNDRLTPPEDVIYTQITQINASQPGWARPKVIKDLFRGGAEKIVSIGCDCVLYSRMIEIEYLLNLYDLVLTPNVLDPIPFDDKLPAYRNHHHYGAINGDFLAIRKSENSVKMMDWFEEALTRYGHMDTWGYCFDQSWISMMPFIFDGVHLLRDRAYNAAPWNVNQRGLVFDEFNQQYEVSTGRLRFFHFSGFCFDHPEFMSHYQNRYKAQGDALKLYLEHKAALAAHGLSSDNYPCVLGIKPNQLTSGLPAYQRVMSPIAP